MLLISLIIVLFVVILVNLFYLNDGEYQFVFNAFYFAMTIAFIVVAVTKKKEKYSVRSNPSSHVKDEKETNQMEQQSEDFKHDEEHSEKHAQEHSEKHMEHSEKHMEQFETGPHPIEEHNEYSTL
jgi:ABC-type nickel/cobalt efflux system permease component RcnA